ncbi:MAG TPA: glycosyl hydrolase family 65 protein [Tepidisphaeraceae bacterium]|jgi:hypothetical protein|nr:glycosyl hydrolase family 65 protein [Tepidisphaeraceae bacterium]
MSVTADNSFVLLVNGKEAGRGESFLELYVFDIAPLLQPGKNVLAVVAVNAGPGVNPAGLIGKAAIRWEGGEVSELISTQWRCSDRMHPGWMTPDFDDTQWPQAVSMAHLGDSPWINMPWAKLDNAIPEHFPTFTVPGQEAQMKSLRQMHHELYRSGARPWGTTWDPWLPAPSLWPAVERGGEVGPVRDRWARTLSNRIIDADGYVSTHQHASYSHDLGWPFPLWPQVLQGFPGVTVGWHFQETGSGFLWQTYGESLKQAGYAGATAPVNWELADAESAGLVNDAWEVKLTGPNPSLTWPSGVEVDAFNAPFLQLRLARAQAELTDQRWRIQWTTEAHPTFDASQEVEFVPDQVNTNLPATLDKALHCLVNMYDHPRWRGQITRVRLLPPAGSDKGNSIAIDSFFTTYDTRHPVNNPGFLMAAVEYFRWTGNVTFVQTNIERLRSALLFCQTDLGGLEFNLIKVTWPGHDGRPGFVIQPDGTRASRVGHGIGNNYWDLLPFGNEDLYATTYYYAATLAMAELEAAIAANPQWGVTAPPRASLTSQALTAHARNVARTANDRFWVKRTGRFAGAIDADGVVRDYGLTFVNNEAVHYGLASSAHARSIVDWIAGRRIVDGDTSTGTDIYHWRFAPRATTLRNTDWYFWAWFGDTVPWGDQVQDGGGVLGFSYHDLSARLSVLGPDDAWARFEQILHWYDDVQAAGGVRAYYDADPSRGKLQGGGPAGGLGVDEEFLESLLVPHFFFDGLLGFRARCDGFEIKPSLPSTWPELRVDRVHFRDSVLEVAASKHRIAIACVGTTDDKLRLQLGQGGWTFNTLGRDGQPIGGAVQIANGAAGVAVELVDGHTLEFVRASNGRKVKS